EAVSPIPRPCRTEKDGPHANHVSAAALPGRLRPDGDGPAGGRPVRLRRRPRLTPGVLLGVVPPRRPQVPPIRHEEMVRPRAGKGRRDPGGTLRPRLATPALLG